MGQLAKQMIGYNLATKQTPKEGVKVNKVIWMLLIIFFICVFKKLEENHTSVLTASNEALLFGNLPFNYLSLT